MPTAQADLIVSEAATAMQALAGGQGLIVQVSNEVAAYLGASGDDALGADALDEKTALAARLDGINAIYERGRDD